MSKRTRKKQHEDKSANIDFETAMEQLESIITSIESGDIGLEQSLAEYEKGVQLIARCRAILENAQQRVETLRRLDADDAGNETGGGRRS